MTKSSHRKGIRLARELISVALEDFDTAKHLFGVGRFRWGLIALQQSLEKAIKAILLSLCIIETEKSLKKKISHKAITRIFHILIEFSEKLEKAIEVLKDILRQMPGITLAPLETLQRGIENTKIELSDLSGKAEEIAKKAAVKVSHPVTDEDREKYEKLELEIMNFINQNYDNANIYELYKVLEALPSEAKTVAAQLINLARPGGPYNELIDILAAFSIWHIVFEYTLSDLRYRALHLDENTFIVWWGRNAIQTIDRLNLISRVDKVVSELNEDICDLIRSLIQTNQMNRQLGKENRSPKGHSPGD
jgi:HEPN domain-containing protein